jgi:uncharacterized protein YciI
MKAGNNRFVRYVVLLSRIPGKSMTEEVIRAHVAHLKQLEQNGQLVLCGPFADYEGGMIVFRAESYEQAKAIAESDPFVTSGVEKYELRTWQLSCKENNHMGMG